MSSKNFNFYTFSCLYSKQCLRAQDRYLGMAIVIIRWFATYTHTVSNFFPFVSGYGDKTPKSLPARIYSAVWMIFGMIILSMFTAEVTSGLTSKELVPLNAFLGKKVRFPPNINVDTRNDKVER